MKKILILLFISFAFDSNGQTISDTVYAYEVGFKMPITNYKSLINSVPITSVLSGDSVWVIKIVYASTFARAARKVFLYTNPVTWNRDFIHARSFNNLTIR